MFRKTALPILVAVVLLAFMAPSHASAAVRFGVTVGPVYPPYPYVYSYPYPYAYPNYYDPYYYGYPYAYGYPHGYYGSGFYWGGHRDFDRRGHEFRGRAWGGQRGFRGGQRGSRGGGHRR
jgi:hypothetical protein